MNSSLATPSLNSFLQVREASKSPTKLLKAERGLISPAVPANFQLEGNLAIPAIFHAQVVATAVIIVVVVTTVIVVVVAAVKAATVVVVILLVSGLSITKIRRPLG